MENSNNFFDPPPLLDWLPGETLFSLVSRNHYLWGYEVDWHTNQLLFGNRNAGIHHDLPNCIAAFADRTGNLLGTADAIARERTLLRYYGRFLSTDDEQEVVSVLSGRTVAHLKSRLGLLTSGFRANHPLKACASCMEEDVLKHGWAYWHSEHQSPGVWWCNTHGEPLRESLFKSTGVGRFSWHLPSTTSLRKWPRKISIGIESASLPLSSLARTTIDLVAGTNSGELTPANLYRAYRVELARRGWLTRGRVLRLSDIAASFLEYSLQLRIMPELGALPATIEESKTQIGRLLRPMRSGTHPIRHVLLIDWLFGDAGSFLNLYRSMPKELALADEENKPDITISHKKDKTNALKENLVRLMTVEGKSASSTAKQLGVDKTTVMVWAAQCGIKLLRHPIILSTERRLLLITDLRNGMGKSIAAQTYGISPGTVTYTLRSEVGLFNAWKKVRLEQSRTKARDAWVKLLSEHGNLKTYQLRRLNQSAYNWLYCNDRLWLQQNLPVQSKITEANKTRIAWDKRDLILSASVEAAALEIRSTSGSSNIHLWQLYQQIPELKAKLATLDRLPLTKRVIERAIGHRPSKSNSDSSVVENVCDKHRR